MLSIISCLLARKNPANTKYLLWIRYYVFKKDRRIFHCQWIFLESLRTTVYDLCLCRSRNKSMCISRIKVRVRLMREFPFSSDHPTSYRPEWLGELTPRWINEWHEYIHVECSDGCEVRLMSGKLTGGHGICFFVSVLMCSEGSHWRFRLHIERDFSYTYI